LLLEMHTSSNATLGVFHFLANLGRGRPLGGHCIGFVLIQLACAIGIKGVICPFWFEDRLTPRRYVCLRGFSWRHVRLLLCVLLGIQQTHGRAIIWHIRRGVLIGGCCVGWRGWRVSRRTSQRGGGALHLSCSSVECT